MYTLSGAQSTAAQLRDTLSTVARDAKADDDFVLVLIGHGSFDGVEYKFNVVGPDVTAAQIAEMCDRIPSRRQLVVNTTSASGGSVAALERPGRAVIAATKSGTEKNATVFARYWVEALQDPAADTDKSDSISAMEAFTYAAKKTAAFYDAQKRLATEHAVFDDIGRGEPVREAGNGQGLLLSSITVLRLGGNLQAANDPAKRALLQKKEELEQKIDTLKYQKAAMDPDRLQEAADRCAGGIGQGAGGVGQMKLTAILLLLCACCRRRARRRAFRLLVVCASTARTAEAQSCFEDLTRSADRVPACRGLLGT